MRNEKEQRMIAFHRIRYLCAITVDRSQQILRIKEASSGHSGGLSLPMTTPSLRTLLIEKWTWLSKKHCTGKWMKLSQRWKPATAWNTLKSIIFPIIQRSVTSATDSASKKSKHSSDAPAALSCFTLLLSPACFLKKSELVGSSLFPTIGTSSINH